MTPSEFNVQEYVSMRFDALERFIDERDRRYEERFLAQQEAVTAALAAVAEQNRQAAVALKETMAKTELAQSVYNVSHNDLAKKMDADRQEVSRTMIPRAEYVISHEALIEKIDRIQADLQSLKEYKSELGGKELKGAADQSRQQWVIGIIIGAISVSVSIITFVALNVVIK